MNTKQRTVSIGIPAYNEAGSIISLLESLVVQEQSAFILEHIIVVCDGGTDKTADVVTAFSRQHPIVICQNDEENHGKISRLNELFAQNTSDIMVTLDADTVIRDSSMVSKLVGAFDDESVGLVGGNDKPLPEGNFFQKIVIASIELWYETRNTINNGDSVHNHHGCLSAVSSRFARDVVIPKAAISDDEYLYLIAKKKGFSFRFARQATLYYRVPATLNDYLIQSTRFMGTEQNIIGIFGMAIEAEYSVPQEYKRKAILTMLKKQPILTPLAIMLQVLVRVLMPFYQDSYKNGTWKRISSTKKVT